MNGFSSLISALKQADSERSVAFKSYGVHSLWYMVHKDNLPSLLTHGVFSHTSIDDLPHEDISMREVNQRRGRTEPIYGRKVHDYAPSYINVKNPMLYVRKDVQHELCLVEIDIEVVDKIEFIFTDGNAAANGTRFYNDLTQLKHLPWDVLQSEFWNDFADGKRKRCAEVLFYPRIEPRYFKQVYCCSSSLYDAISHLDNRIQYDSSKFFR